MSGELVLDNARLVLRDEVVLGAVTIRDGLIHDLERGRVGVGEDFDGDYLIPGAVELHTDHAEYHMRPRPDVEWEPTAAVLAHDAQMTAAGATTVLDAVRLGSGPDDDAAATARAARRLTEAIIGTRQADVLRADHLMHLRCEISAPDCLEQFESYADHPLVRLVSLMDHTPGQRQFESVDQFKKYYVGRGRMSETEIEAYVDGLGEQAHADAESTRLSIAAGARRRGVPVAAHDDATVDHVIQSAGLGAAIAEFPTTVGAASAAAERGLVIVMGAPNLVRGRSHSGNVSASTLFESGLLHILSSDYVPSSPLQAVFRITSEGTASLPEAVRLISTNPARAVGLDDRGAIEIGKRADLVRVRTTGVASTSRSSAGVVPVVRSVYRQGMRVL